MLREKVKERLQAQSDKLVKGKTLADLPPLDSMLNLGKGAELLVQKLLDGERTLIVGDYDADGILATTILYGFLADVGFNKTVLDFIIPSRMKDGYGLSPNIIHYAVENDFQVIVTVDNGIAANEAIALAKEKGLTVIVTDHHTAPAVLPDADVIINPKQPGETFPFIDISGATVAWYFAAKIKEVLGLKIDMRKYLDLAGLTVISDVMPLTDINLAIFNFTLNQLKQRRRFIYELIWDENQAPCIDEVSVGFSLVPMINAIGRIDNANKGVNLFLSRDKGEIQSLFDEMKAINEERKKRTLIYKNNALELLEDYSGDVIIVRNKDYHEGIVGIIAGKLSELYKRPAYVFSWNHEKGIWKGSGRSSGEIHLYELTNAATKHIAGFGGHKGAVGLAVKDEEFEDFERALQEAVKKYKPEDFLDASTTPFECSLEDINFELYDLVHSYGPFGEGNRLPQFKTKCKIIPERELSGGLHFACSATIGNVKMKAMAFHIKNRDEFLEKISADEVEILFDMNKSYYAKRDTYSLEIFFQLA